MRGPATKHQQPDSGRQNVHPARKRWLRLGPGLAVALALSAAILLWPTLRDGFQADPARIERSRLGEIPPPAAAPELGWLLERKDALGLKPVQVAKLRRVQRRWDRDTEVLRGALDLAAAQFSRERGASAARGVDIQGLRAQAAPVSSLSRQLAEARRVYWNEAAQILTPRQRSQAEAAWTRGFRER